jgi:hypothetical protein
MKRLSFLLVLAVFAGCKGAGEPNVVARSGEWTLTESRLADLLVLAQPFPLETEPAAELARHWIGASAMAQRAAAGEAFDSDEAVEASTWLERREALLTLERVSRIGSPMSEDPRVVFDRSEVRLVAHVLRQVGPETPAAERELQRRTSDRILATLVRGGSWDAAVSESEDLDTKRSAGLLGLFGPGELPPALDRATFRLQPGQVSAVIESPLGFHILYRPRYEDVSDLFATRFRERRLYEADAAANAEVLQERRATRSPDAPALLRRMAGLPRTWLASETEVVTWQGGALTEGTVAHYVAGLPAASRAEMANGADSTLAAFVDDLSVRELRVADARAQDLALDDAMLAQLRGQHESEIAEWFDVLGLGQGEAAQREAIERHMEGLVARQRSAPALPLLFEVWLLDGVAWSLSDSGVEGAIARARNMLENAGR